MMSVEALAKRRPAVAGLAVAVLAVLAWLALWAWQASPYGRYLDHDGLAGSALGSSALLAVFLAGWLLMIVAMMLPSTLPLVGLFAGVVAGRGDRRRLLAWLVGGYLAVWVGAGLAALAGDAALHAIVAHLEWLERRPEVIAAAVMTCAGLYQFTPLKDRCLSKCRSPRLLIFAAWRGSRPAAEAFGLGARHGRFCLGCCWALMLLMFAFGAGSIGWMLGLGAVMAIEKNAAWGASLTGPLGAALLAGAAGLLVIELV